MPRLKNWKGFRVSGFEKQREERDQELEAENKSFEVRRDRSRARERGKERACR